MAGYPEFITGSFKVDGSFSSSSGLNVDIGMKPGYLELRATDYSAPSSSSVIVGIDVDFNTTNQFNHTLTNSSALNMLTTSIVTTASSSSNAVTVLDSASVSASSSSSVIVSVQVVGRQGFNIANGLASGSWKGKTIYFRAHRNTRYRALGTLE